MRVEIEINAPWIIGAIKDYAVWKIWCFYVFNGSINKGIRIMGVSVTVRRCRTSNGVNLHLNF